MLKAKTKGRTNYALDDDRGVLLHEIQLKALKITGKKVPLREVLGIIVGLLKDKDIHQRILDIIKDKYVD